MGEIIEHIGGKVEKILIPIWYGFKFALLILFALAGICVPIAAIKYLFFG